MAIEQSAITLLTAAFGSVIGAGIAWGVMSEKVKTLQISIKEVKETEIKDLKNNVVWKDSCVECKSNWGGQLADVKTGIHQLNDKMDQVINAVVIK